MTRWIGIRFGIASHIFIRVHSLCIALHRICRHKHPHHRIVVPRPVIIQPRHKVRKLPRKSLTCTDRALLHPPIAVWPIHLIPQHHRRCIGQIVETGDHTAERIRQQEIGGRRTR